jgi:chaperonin GroES
MTQRLTPLNDRVVILPDPVTEFFDDSEQIQRPDIAQEVPNEGTIISVGQGRYAELTGQLIPMRTRVGQKVLFGKYSGSEVRINRVLHKVMREDELLGLVEGTPDQPEPPPPAPTETIVEETSADRLQRLREAAGG